MSLKRYGVGQFGLWVDGNIEQANRMHEIATAHPRFESAVRPPMSAGVRPIRPGG